MEKVKCKICDKEFKSNIALGQHMKRYHGVSTKEYYDIYLRKKNEGICPTCGKETTFKSIGIGYLKFCSPSCSMQSNETQKKFNSTMQNKYGVNWAAQNKEIYSKMLDTNEKRYGEKYNLHRKEILQKILECAHTEEANQKRVVSRKATIENRYGVAEIFLRPDIYAKTHSKETDNKRSNTMKSKTTAEIELSHKKRAKTMQSKISQFEKDNNCTLKSKIIEKYGQGWLHEWDKIEKIYNGQNTYILNTGIPLIEDYVRNPEKYYNKKDSLPEKELRDYLSTVFSGEIICNTKSVIYPYELDIYIPEKKLGIEFNGVYWHSINFGKSKDYHLIKSKLCEEKGIRLIHIFEDEWDTKKEICKDIILSAMGIFTKKIYARDCTVQEVNSNDAQIFLNTYHLQGNVNSSYRLGLFYKQELVQLICIGKSRFTKDEYELLRMCSKSGLNVVGGFSKLIVNQPYINIISYVDRAKFNGLGYLQNGFTLETETPPSYFYWRKDTGRLNRYKTQKHLLQKLLGSNNVDMNLTEKENMIANGFLQIYDCGNYKMRYKR